MQQDHLRVFVASSSEQLGAARRVRDALRVAAEQARDASGPKGAPLPLDVVLWDEDVFDYSASYFESLEAELDRADFAAIILTGDDLSIVRNKLVSLPRDNAIFELGLFIGRLERNRCFFFIEEKTDTRIASDLLGIHYVEYLREKPKDPADRKALAVSAAKVCQQMLDLGPRYKPGPDIRHAQREMLLFCRRLEGGWWERMRTGDDDASALSYLTISVDEVTNTPRLEGRAYQLDGAFAAEWHSISTAIRLGKTNPRLFYRWEGEHELSRGERYGGGGEIVFDTYALKAGKGYFYDTNYASLRDRSRPQSRVKRVALARASAKEVETMRHDRDRQAKTLIRRKLKALEYS